MATFQKVAGLDKLAYALQHLPREIAKKQLAKPVAIAGKMIRDDAQRRAPVDTGRLQQAVLLKRIPASSSLDARYIVGVRHGKQAQTAKKWGGTVNLDAYYWTFVEFGTSKMAAKPFLRPAFEANKETALTMIVNGIREGVEIEAAALAWGRG